MGCPFGVTGILVLTGCLALVWAVGRSFLEGLGRGYWIRRTEPKPIVGHVLATVTHDSTILVVKNIITIPLSIIEEQQFFDVIKNVSRLRHLNIVTLVGFCMEHGHHLIVYEYIRSMSLDEALHCAAYTPLSWGLRLRIALGVARAFNYMHSSIVPPVAHSNLKAANVLLDEDLMPRVCDCGLTILRSLASSPVKLNSRPKVKWASSRLHDSSTLRQMIDPAITRTISSKSLSHFADIVSMCIQAEQEFRSHMYEIVESLMSLLQRPSAADGIEDPLSRSFRSE
ncbi:hypothetical protein OROHE_022730 [Orobanche hederae]